MEGPSDLYKNSYILSAKFLNRYGRTVTKIEFTCNLLDKNGNTVYSGTDVWTGALAPKEMTPFSKEIKNDDYEVVDYNIIINDVEFLFDDETSTVETEEDKETQ